MKLRKSNQMWNQIHRHKKHNTDMKKIIILNVRFNFFLKKVVTELLHILTWAMIQQHEWYGQLFHCDKPGDSWSTLITHFMSCPH